LLDVAINNNTDPDKLAELALILTVENSNQEYIIKVNYHANIPFKNDIERLISTTPLKSEVARLEEYSQNLEQQKAQLPTPENFDKLTKQKEALSNYLQGSLDADEYLKIIDQINQIK
jgi:hypothetical protein